MSEATIQLTLRVDYTLCGTPVEELEKQLKAIVEHAVNEGQLTGYTEAMVEDYRLKVEANPITRN